MNIQDTDFPSDTNDELPCSLRTVLAEALRRAAASKTACAKVEETFIFAIKKLKEAKAGHKEV